MTGVRAPMVQPMDNDRDLTIEHLAPLIERKKISPVELTRFLLDRIARLEPAINAYITVTAESALAGARRAEREIARGKYRGALHGIPVSLKDLFCTRGVATTAGSRILRDFVPDRNAVVVDRLLGAGCLLLGKANLHEFAYGPTSVNPHYGAVRNPWDPGRISGGSSGGSAAGVVAALAIASLGTDTGGSIRIPAAACGCVGLKPTRGLVPLDGVIPLSFTLDHVGPLCRSVADAAALLLALSEPRFENGRWRRMLRGMRRGVKGLRIGVPRDYFFDHLEPGVRRAVLEAVEVFRRLGAEVTEVGLEGMEHTARLAAEITGDEAAAFHDRWLRRRAKSYGRDVRERLAPSRRSTAVAYLQALEEMRAYGGRLDRVLESVDVLAAPTLPLPAPALDQTEFRTGRRREEVRTALLRLTRPANLSGLPALSLPCGFSAGGLPVGLQLIGRRLDEPTLLRAAWAYEGATPWHEQFPPDPAAAGAPDRRPEGVS